jgi:integrase
LDTLISASSRLHAPLLQFLKESGARIGEASQIEWTDVDLERKIVSVNHPEKGSKARLCPISEKLRTMLGQLPRPNNLSLDSKKKVSEKSLKLCETAQQPKWQTQDYKESASTLSDIGKAQPNTTKPKTFYTSHQS